MLLKTNDINTYRENEDSCKDVSLILFPFFFRTATSVSRRLLRFLGHVGGCHVVITNEADWTR